MQACRGTFYVLYEVREDLGEGAFGKVVKVRRRRDGRMFVAKIMHDRGMSDKARQEVRHRRREPSRKVLSMAPGLEQQHCAELPSEASLNAAAVLCYMAALPNIHACLMLHSLQCQDCLQAQNEVAVLALLDHPNVVKYYECFAEQGTKVKVVMELCEVRSAPSCAPAHSQPFLSYCNTALLCHCDACRTYALIMTC